MLVEKVSHNVASGVCKLTFVQFQWQQPEVKLGRVVRSVDQDHCLVADEGAEVEGVVVVRRWTKLLKVLSLKGLRMVS